MSDVVTEWEVAWFPTDGPDRSRVFKDEGRARAHFDHVREIGANPILSTRTVTTTPWHIVDNAGGHS